MASRFQRLAKPSSIIARFRGRWTEQAKRAQDARGRMADIAGKGASKTAEAAGSALTGAAIGSVIPGIGTAIGGALGGVLGGIGAEALVDWLRGFLNQPDIDLLLDPDDKTHRRFSRRCRASRGQTANRVDARHVRADDRARRLGARCRATIAPEHAACDCGTRPAELEPRMG